jgi:hypothetical protein
VVPGDALATSAIPSRANRHPSRLTSATGFASQDCECCALSRIIVARNAAMKKRQFVIVLALLAFFVWSGYYAYLSWKVGPTWRVIVSHVSLLGFLTLLVIYLQYLLEDPRKK